MKTPITLPRLRQHWTYHWWQYALAILLSVLMVNLLFSVTEPRIPATEKLELYVYGSVRQEEIDAWLEELRAEYFPDQRQITVTEIIADETYGAMVISAHVAAGEGDLFLLPREIYQNFADQGLFLALDDVFPVESLPAAEQVNLERAYRRDAETGEKHLYGVPVSAVPRLQAATSLPASAILGARNRYSDDDRALHLLLLLLQDGNDGQN